MAPKKLSLLLCISIFVTGPVTSFHAAESSKPSKVLYDTKADGKKQIKAALKVAAKEKKNVLLKFGANWCSWCQLLSGTFESNPEIAQILKENYVVVLIDVDKDYNQSVEKKYGDPTQNGLPALVVLDQKGKQLCTKDTAELEDGDHYNLQKVTEFLLAWKPVKTRG